ENIARDHAGEQDHGFQHDQNRRRYLRSPSHGAIEQRQRSRSRQGRTVVGDVHGKPKNQARNGFKAKAGPRTVTGGQASLPEYFSSFDIASSPNFVRQY